MRADRGRFGDLSEGTSTTSGSSTGRGRLAVRGDTGEAAERVNAQRVWGAVIGRGNGDNGDNGERSCTILAGQSIRSVVGSRCSKSRWGVVGAGVGEEEVDEVGDRVKVDNRDEEEDI